jgi:hypothetical protein
MPACDQPLGISTLPRSLTRYYREALCSLRPSRSDSHYIARLLVATALHIVCRNGHDVALTVCSIAAIIRGATPSRRRMVTSPIAISINHLSAIRQAYASLWRSAREAPAALTTTGVKAPVTALATSAAGEAEFMRSCSFRCRLNGCCGNRPCRRPVGDNSAGAWLSRTMRVLIS